MVKNGRFLNTKIYFSKLYPFFLSPAEKVFTTLTMEMGSTITTFIQTVPLSPLLMQICYGMLRSVIQMPQVRLLIPPPDLTPRLSLGKYFCIPIDSRVKSEFIHSIHACIINFNGRIPSKQMAIN